MTCYCLCLRHTAENKIKLYEAKELKGDTCTTRGARESFTLVFLLQVSKERVRRFPRAADKLRIRREGLATPWICMGLRHVADVRAGDVCWCKTGP